MNSDPCSGKGVLFEHYGAGPLQTDAEGIHRDDMVTIAWLKGSDFLALIEQAAQDRFRSERGGARERYSDPCFGPLFRMP